LSPREELDPGENFGPLGLLSSTTLVNTFYSLEEWRGEQNIFTSRGPTSPLGVRLTPRDEIKNLPHLQRFLSSIRGQPKASTHHRVEGLQSLFNYFLWF
jgi:hypothetical protein